MNIAAKAAMLGEEPKKTRKQERVEKKAGRLAGKVRELSDKGDKYFLENTPKEEQSGKERRYHKKFGKTIDKWQKSIIKADGVDRKEEAERVAKKDKTDFTRVPKDDKPASSSTSTGEKEPTSKKRGKYSDLNFTTVGTKEEVEKQPKKTEFTKVGTEENTSKRNSDDVYGTASERNKNPKKEIEFTKVGTEEDEPTMSRRERRQERKEDKREYTKVPQDDASSTATPTPSDIETKAAIVSGKYSLTKFKPKK